MKFRLLNVLVSEDHICSCFAGDTVLVVVVVSRQALRSAQCLADFALADPRVVAGDLMATHGLVGQRM